MRRVLGLALGATLLSLSLSSSQGASASQGVEWVSAPLCSPNDDSRLWENSTLTTEGHYEYQDWLAAPEAQAAIAEVNAVVDGLPKSSTYRGAVEFESFESLHSHGVLGIGIDHVDQAVYVVVDTSQLDPTPLVESLQAVAGPLHVVVREACRTIAEIADGVRIVSERAWHPDAARSSYGYTVDPMTSTIDVTVAPEATEVAEALVDLLGDLVVVDFGEPSRRGRLDDGEPHWGGAGIGLGNGNFCTSGFTIKVNSNGHVGSVTAGHCFNNGQHVFSGPEYYGRANSKPAFPTWDMIRIGPNGEVHTNKIHVDPCCPTVRTVTGSGDTQVGAIVCVSGMVTRAKCGLEVTDMSSVLCDDAGCTGNLGLAELPGQVVGQGGDSGAPIYSKVGTANASIRGMEIGGLAADQVMFHKISAIKTMLGLTVKVT